MSENTERTSINSALNRHSYIRSLRALLAAIALSSFSCSGATRAIKSPDPIEIKNSKILKQHTIKVRRAIFNLDFQSTRNPDGLKKVQKQLLDAIKASIFKLREMAKQSKKANRVEGEITELELMIEDLTQDHASGRKLNLDTSLEKVVKMAQKRISKCGVTKLSGAELEKSKAVGEVMKYLKGQKIKPAFGIVVNDNAPVAIEIAQIHPTARAMIIGNVSARAVKSQKFIEDFFSDAGENGILKSVYIEGVHDGGFDAFNRFSPREKTELISGLLGPMGIGRAKKRLGDKIKLKGFEEKSHFLKGAIITLRGRYYPFRSTLDNIFIARNIAHRMQRDGDKIAGVTIGSGHELYKNQRVKTVGGTVEYKKIEHPLPLSCLLAAEGYNVVVIDSVSQ